MCSISEHDFKKLLHYKLYDSLAFCGLSLLFFTGKKKKRSFSLVRDTKSEVLHVPVWTQFYDLGLNAQVDVRNSLRHRKCGVRG